MDESPEGSTMPFREAALLNAFFRFFRTEMGASVTATGRAITSHMIGTIGELLTGPTALATSTDPVSAAKIAVEFAKTNDKLEIVGGGMGDVVLDVNGVKALASLPSLDELRAKIIGLVQAPATKVAQIAAAPAGQLARVFGAYAAKEAA